MGVGRLRYAGDAASHDGYSTAEADDLVNVSRIGESGVGVCEWRMEEGAK